jgi:hypothetical protein
MRTHFRDGVVDLELSKPETIAFQKALDIVTSFLSTPIANALRKPVTEVAQTTATGLASLIKLIGRNAYKNVLPLIDSAPVQGAVDGTPLVATPPPPATPPATEMPASSIDATPPAMNSAASDNGNAKGKKSGGRAK